MNPSTAAPLPPDRWRLVQNLFAAASALPPGQRAPYLELHCKGDASLIAEVRSLLAFDTQDSADIELAVTSSAADLISDDPRIGQRVGPYRIEAELARGGMGAVYLAFRDDDQFRKQVAVKLIKRGMDTTSVIGRFRHERQILANLDHPYVARLLDGGTTGDGLPYFVMEYVKGLPIDEYCESKKLSIEDRCHLFDKVCQAVAYAHRNLVVHRDLKPSNILVTADGDPKLLDFGIAKVLTDETSEATILNTQAFLRPLTPDYASPEQVRGLSVSTATDVYSLGAVLFELLTSKRPHKLSSYTQDELIREICEQTPHRPSDIATQPTARRLAGDLDNIVLMAMRKEPERRYQSVLQLQEDLHRHLTGMPVVAREDTFRYRAGKFLRRQRYAVAAGAFLALSAAAGVMAILSSARLADQQRTVAQQQAANAEIAHTEAEQQRDVAVRETKRAIEAAQRAEDNQAKSTISQRKLNERQILMIDLANNTMLKVFDELETVPGSIEARRKIAISTRAFLDHLNNDDLGSPELALLLARTYMRLGDVYGQVVSTNLGDTDSALKYYRNAEVLYAKALKVLPFDAERRVSWFGVQDRIGRILEARGQMDEAIALYQRALPVVEEAVRLVPEKFNRAQIRIIHNRLSVLLSAKNDPAASFHAAEEIRMMELDLAESPNDPMVLLRASNSYSAQARAHNAKGQFKEGLAKFKRSAEIREDLLKRTPSDPSALRNMMISYGHLGDSHNAPGVPELKDADAAKAYYLKAVDIAERLVKADKADIRSKYDLGNGLSRLGRILSRPQDYAESMVVLQRAVDAFEEVRKSDPSVLVYSADLATVLVTRGDRYGEASKIEDAKSSYERSIALSDWVLSKDKSAIRSDATVYITLKNLALLKASIGDRKGALEVADSLLNRAHQMSPDLRVRNGRFEPLAYYWQGSIYEMLARQNQSASRLADWKSAQEAYRISEAGWVKLTDVQTVLSREEIRLVPIKIAECTQQINQLMALR